MPPNYNSPALADAPKAAQAPAKHFCDVALKDLRHHDLKSGTKLYQYALQIYLADASPLLNRIVSGIETANHEQVRRAAHSLKSNSLLVGAVQVAEAAGNIEQCASLAEVLAAHLGRDLEDLLDIANREILLRLQSATH